MTTFADRLKESRVRAGLTQEGLAKAIGQKSQSVISSIESGQNKSTSYLPEIAKAVGVDAFWLKTGKGSPNSAALKPDEQLILEAFRLFDDDRREVWLLMARQTVKDTNAKQTKAA